MQQTASNISITHDRSGNHDTCACRVYMQVYMRILGSFLSSGPLWCDIERLSAPGQPTQQVLKLDTPISALTSPPALT